MNQIEISNISKKYGRVKALDNINLIFEENKIYGLLGRNGAGKTTLLKIISNRIFADQGKVLIDGQSAAKNSQALHKLYMISEETLFPETMKIRDVFKWTENFYPDFDRQYANDLAQQFELNTAKKINSLSTGYDSICKLIVALAVNTPYLLLDEPVLGLDANNRDLFYRLLIAKYSEKPFTIIISTHLIEEISSLVESIIIIKKGAIIRNQSREQLLAEGFTISGTARAVDAFVADKNIIGSDSLGGLKSAYVLGEKPQQLPEDLEISNLDLQKLFIQLTNS